MNIPDGFIERLIDLTIQIQQCPAPSYHEGQRAALIANLFSEAGLVDVTLDDAKNAYGRLPGGSAKPLVISAHSDTVFPDLTPLAAKREADKVHGAGIGDNSLGVAGLFGILWLIRTNQFQPSGDIWFVANSCEEGLGDLNGMKAVVRRFGSAPLAYLVLEGMGVERIVNAGLGSKRYRVELFTQGGHSWGDYGQPSAIHEMARLIDRLLRVRISKKPRTSFNIGTISGGTSVNTIAASTTVQLDLRSVDAGTLKKKSEEMLKIIVGFNHDGVQVKVTPIGDRPTGSLPKDHALVKLAVKALKAQNLKAELEISSTDCNVPLSQGIPSICLGITHGKGAHTYDESIEVRPIEAGMRQLYAFVIGVWQALNH